MGLETGTYIGDLVAANPTGTDSKGQGDDHLRLIKKTLKDSFAGFAGAVVVTGPDIGTANTIVITPATALPGYVDGMAVRFTPANANTGATTINISGLGAKPLKAVGGAPLLSGEISTSCWFQAIYDETGDVFLLEAVTKTYAEQLAFSAALPGQTGNAGKILQTDGVNAAWAEKYPTLTGTAGRSLRSTGSTTAWEWTGLSGAYAVSTGTTVQMDNDVAPIIRVTPTAANVSVEMPDATTLTQRGREYEVSNAGNYSLGVRDYDGTLLTVIPPKGAALLVAVDVATAAGAWDVINPDEIGCLVWPSVTLAAEVITGSDVAQLTTDKAIVVWSTTTGIKAAVLTRSGTTLTLGSPITVSAVANPGGPSVGVLSATSAVVAWSEQGLDWIKAAALSISGTTVTAGSVVTIDSGFDYAVGVNICAIDSSRAVISYSGSWVAVVSVSGTALTAGTPVVGSAFSAAGALVALGSGSFLFVGGAGARACSTSVTTITLGAVTSLGVVTPAVIASSTGHAMIIDQQGSVGDVSIYVAASGSTISSATGYRTMKGKSIRPTEALAFGDLVVLIGQFSSAKIGRFAGDAFHCIGEIDIEHDFSGPLVNPTVAPLTTAVGVLLPGGGAALLGAMVEFIN